MKSFGETCLDVGYMVQRDQDANYSSKIQNWVNLAQIKAVNAYDYWKALQSITPVFSSIAGQEVYYMPSDFDKPYRIYDLTNANKLVITTREEYYDANIYNISQSTQGQPLWAMFYGISAIAYVEKAGFTVKVKSSSVSDTAGYIVRVEGWLDAANTILGYTNITISSSSPTTYVTDPNSTTFYGITRITKSSYQTAGYFTIADSSGNVLATIPQDDTQSRYPNLYLGLIPNAVINYQCLYKRRVKRMVDTNDYLFTEGIEDYVIMEATAYAYNEEKDTQPRAQQMFDEAKMLLGAHITNEQSKLGEDYQNKMIPQTFQAHRT